MVHVTRGHTLNIDAIIHCDALERATIISALKAWQISLERDNYDSDLVSEDVGTLTADETAKLIAALTE